MELFDGIRATGVLAALAGAGFLALQQLSVPNAPAFWILFTLVGPVLLAFGNLYRTIRWPVGEHAEGLATGMLGAATLMLLLTTLLPGFSVSVPTQTATPFLIIAIQAAIFAAQFLLMFVLQKTGGPVFLSLLGAVGAVVGIPVAILLLGEAAPRGLPEGAALIALGVALVAIGGQRAKKNLMDQEGLKP
jgi:drug/metabolite transporter (DMT)-like permease